MRTIDQNFITDLTHEKLAFFLKQVHQNRKELSLEIRNGYINIYYKGGNLLRITQTKKGYSFHFDAKYCLHKDDDSNYELLQNLRSNDIAAHIKYFDLMKHEMDTWFEKHPKAERDFQHALLVNNPCIIDIEYQIRNIMRLDMLMVVNGKLIIVENKYGTGAIGGKSGIKEHYEDICSVLADPTLYKELLDSICSISSAKRSLGLSESNIQASDIIGTEILFLFANYNTESTSIQKAVKTMTKTVPANILMMNPDEHNINMTRIEDLFTYGS